MANPTVNGRRKDKKPENLIQQMYEKVFGLVIILFLTHWVLGTGFLPMFTFKGLHEIHQRLYGCQRCRIVDRCSASAHAAVAF